MVAVEKSEVEVVAEIVDVSKGNRPQRWCVSVSNGFSGRF
jgi:hypothetical protein